VSLIDQPGTSIRRALECEQPCLPVERRAPKPGCDRPAAHDRPAARIRALRKVFSNTAVLDAVDLDIPTGSIFGLLGPNGSGKTTVLRVLLGLCPPTSGSVELLGEPIPARSRTVLPHVGAVLDGSGFHPFLTGRQNLNRCASAEPLLSTAHVRHAVETALRRVGLADWADRAYRRYSPGMRQRLALASVLLAPRRFVVLDEPSHGLDPAGVYAVRRLIAELHADGATVLVSSHRPAEIEAICTHLAMLVGGSMVVAGELASLLRADDPVLEVHTAAPAAAVAALRAARVPARLDRELVVVELAASATPATSAASATPGASATSAADVISALVRAGVPVSGARPRRVCLDELFARLTEEET